MERMEHICRISSSKTLHIGVNRHKRSICSSEGWEGIS